MNSKFRQVFVSLVFATLAVMAGADFVGAMTVFLGSGILFVLNDIRDKLDGAK